MNTHFSKYHLEAVQIYVNLKSQGFSDSDIRNTLNILLTSLDLFSTEIKEELKIKR